LAAAVTGRRGSPRRFPHVRLVLGGWLPPHAIPARCPRFGAGGLVVRSCAGPSQALAPVRRVEGGSHAADQARGPNRTARPVRLRGGSMAGTEWASEIRVVNASDTLRLILRPRRAMGIVLYRGPRSFSCCFPCLLDAGSGVGMGGVSGGRWCVRVNAAPEAALRARSLTVATPVHVPRSGRVIE